MTGPDDLLSTSDVATLAGVHQMTVYEWVWRGHLEAPDSIRDRRGAVVRYRFRREAVEAFLDQRAAGVQRVDRVPVGFRLSEAEQADLARLAATTGVGKSAAVRQAIAAALQATEDA